ncbi:MAG TPA: hypothetical protein VF258_00350 [Luteolibacter sp.]
MKNTLLLSLLLAVPAFAGSTQVITESSPPPTQNTWSWFVGGTAGYLVEFDEDMYTFQLGARSPWSLAGWSVSFYGEAGWTENHEDVELAPPLVGDADGDMDIVPLTFNVKFDRLLTGGLSAYIGGGVGASYLDAELEAPFSGDESADDWVFTGQIFAGLAYQVNDAFEIFGGARWIHFEDPDFAGISLDDDVLLEGGLRFHF